MFLLLDWTIFYEAILHGLQFYMVSKKFRLSTLPTVDWWDENMVMNDGDGDGDKGEE